jgi:integrase/recombinase XerC
MRIERAIDAFLDWRRLERDATPRSIDSYRRILEKLAEDYPEVVLDRLTTQDLRGLLGRWRESSAATRSNVISVLHSFFAWAEAEDVIEYDPSRKIRRPRSVGPMSTDPASMSSTHFAARLAGSSARQSS